MDNNTTTKKRDPVFHDLKIDWIYFPYIISETKSYEIRKNDRDYRVGDILILREWRPDIKEYTGRLCTREVVWILNRGEFGLEYSFIVMTLKKY